MGKGNAEAMTELHTLTHGDRDRSYLLHVPPSPPPARWPVVLVLHGSGTHAAAMRDFCGLDELADRAGFVTVYPNGTGRVDHARSWNAGDCCGHAYHHKVDDVGFCEAVLAEVEQRLPIDTTRIYATGMSNGGMMAYRLAAESNRIAAVASICGPLGFDAIPPRRGIPVIHFHGTEDLFTPYNGGTGPRSISQGRFRSVAQTIAAWVQANDCDPTPERSLVADGQSDGLPITRDHYCHGRDESEVILYTIKHGGHTWPGRPRTLEFLGSATQAISANDLLWEFFGRHPQPHRKKIGVGRTD